MIVYRSRLKDEMSKALSVFEQVVRKALVKRPVGQAGVAAPIHRQAGANAGGQVLTVEHFIGNFL